MKYNRVTFFTVVAVGVSCTTAFFTNLQPGYSQKTPSQAPINSQTEQKVNRQELQQFVQAYKAVQQIQKSSEKQMVEAVKTEGLSPARFIEISKSEKNPATDSSATDISNREKQGFENAKAKIIVIKQKTESDLTQAINAQGLELPRFNEILTALQQDSQLREQFQQMIVN